MKTRETPVSYDVNSDYENESEAEKPFDPFSIIYHTFTGQYMRMIGGSATMVYLALYHIAGQKFKCFPGMPFIAEFTGLSERSVRTCVDVLQEYGLIRVEERRLKNGRRTSHLYKIMGVGSLKNRVPEEGNSNRQILPVGENEVEITEEPPANFAGGSNRQNLPHNNIDIPLGYISPTEVIEEFNKIESIPSEYIADAIDNAPDRPSPQTSPALETPPCADSSPSRIPEAVLDEAWDLFTKATLPVTPKLVKRARAAAAAKAPAPPKPPRTTAKQQAIDDAIAGKALVLAWRKVRFGEGATYQESDWYYYRPAVIAMLRDGRTPEDVTQCCNYCYGLWRDWSFVTPRSIGPHMDECKKNNGVPTNSPIRRVGGSNGRPLPGEINKRIVDDLREKGYFNK